MVTDIEITVAEITTTEQDKEGIAMNEYLKKVESYILSMEIFKSCYKQGIFSAAFYKEIEEETAKEYGLKKKSIYRLNYLIDIPINGNM